MSNSPSDSVRRSRCSSLNDGIRCRRGTGHIGDHSAGAAVWAASGKWRYQCGHRGDNRYRCETCEPLLAKPSRKPKKLPLMCATLDANEHMVFRRRQGKAAGWEAFHFLPIDKTIMLASHEVHESHCEYVGTVTAEQMAKMLRDGAK